MPGLPSLNKTLVITVKNYAKVYMEVLRYRPITLDSFTLFHIVLSAIVEEKKHGLFSFQSVRLLLPSHSDVEEHTRGRVL